MPMIRFTGQIDVAPGSRDGFVAGLPDHIRLTRADPGCRGNDATPDPSAAGRWRVADPFESRQAVEAHKARTDRRAWSKASAGVRPSIHVEEIDG